MGRRPPSKVTLCCERGVIPSSSPLCWPAGLHRSPVEGPINCTVNVPDLI